jgi:hypothetical protein
MTLGLTQLLTEMRTRNISWGYMRPVRRADNLTTFMYLLSWNLGGSTSWNPLGLSRTVMGLLYLFTVTFCSSLFSATINDIPGVTLRIATGINTLQRTGDADLRF